MKYISLIFVLLILGCVPYKEKSDSIWGFGGGHYDYEVKDEVYLLSVESNRTPFISIAAVEKVWIKRAMELCKGGEFSIIGVRGYSYDPIGSFDPVSGLGYNIDTVDGYLKCNSSPLSREQAIEAIKEDDPNLNWSEFENERKT